MDKERDSLYLGSPMTGIPRRNRPRLAKFEADWAAATGMTIVNPGKFYKEGDDPSQAECRRKSLAELVTCKYMAVLPEWKDYPESFVHDEMSLARRINMPIFEAESYANPQPLLETILETAQRYVYGGRDRQYGHPREAFSVIANLWTGYFQARAAAFTGGLPYILDRVDVANIYTLGKMARTMHQVSRDDLVDMAGYPAALARALNIDP